MSSAAAATTYVRRMIENEAKGWGDNDNALSRLSVRYGLPYWTLNNIRTGRAKTVEAGFFARIRSAYLDACERQITRLQQELAIEKAVGANDDLEDLVAEAEALAARIQAKRAAR